MDVLPEVGLLPEFQYHALPRTYFLNAFRFPREAVSHQFFPFMRLASINILEDRTLSEDVEVVRVGVVYVDKFGTTAVVGIIAIQRSQFEGLNAYEIFQQCFFAKEFAVPLNQEDKEHHHKRESVQQIVIL